MQHRPDRAGASAGTGDGAGCNLMGRKTPRGQEVPDAGKRTHAGMTRGGSAVPGTRALVPEPRCGHTKLWPILAVVLIGKTCCLPAPASRDRQQDGRLLCVCRSAVLPNMGVRPTAATAATRRAAEEPRMCANAGTETLLNRHNSQTGLHHVRWEFYEVLCKEVNSKEQSDLLITEFRDAFEVFFSFFFSSSIFIIFLKSGSLLKQNLARSMWGQPASSPCPQHLGEAPYTRMAITNQLPGLWPGDREWEGRKACRMHQESELRGAWVAPQL